MDFDLFKKYSELVKDCPIKEIGEKINYYYADDAKLNIGVSNLIDIDMKSAFPNICRILWPDSEFVKQLFLIENKLEKNIFLTNALIKHKEETGINYLVSLNNFAKMFVLGYIYNTYDNIQIFEFKKDGVLFRGVPLNGCIDTEFSSFIDENFKFHVQHVSQYYRLCHLRTSIYRYQFNEYTFKGTIKTIPTYINKSFFNDILGSNQLYSNELLEFIKIYDINHFKLLKTINFFDKIKEYYLFNDKYYLTANNKLELDAFNFNPSIILINFIYPLLSLARSEM